MMKQMLWMAVAGVFLFTGCSSEKEFECPQSYNGPLTSDEQALVGNWKLSALEGSLAIDMTDDDIDNASTDLYAQLDPCVLEARYQLAENREMNYYGSMLNEEICEEELMFGGSWKSDGKVLNILAGCAIAGFNIDTETEVPSFGYTAYEQVRNYSGMLIPMQVTYTFSRVIEQP